MDKLKGKYDVVLAIATIVISLGAFKEELSHTHISISGYFFSVKDYLFVCVIGFSISLYLYLIDKTFEGTDLYSKYKIFSIVILTAYIIHTATLATPILLLVIIVIQYLVDLVKPLEEYQKIISGIMSAISGFFSGLAVYYFARYRYSLARYRKKEAFEELKAIELEKSKKLIENGFYSNAIIEMYNALENHIKARISQRQYNTPVGRTYEILKIGAKMGIISHKETVQMQMLRQMRNQAAHSIKEFDKEETTKMYEFVRDVIMR